MQPCNTSLLQIVYEPVAYQEHIRQHLHPGIEVYRKEETNWSQIPDYVIARCPLCSQPYTGQLDTHSLAGWRNTPAWEKSVYNSDHQSIGCKHFVAVQTFLHLNGHVPVELGGFTSFYDVPFVMPTFLPEHLVAYAVIHCLPICRIEDESGQALLLTLYRTDPTLLGRFKLWLQGPAPPPPLMRDVEAWTLPPEEADFRFVPRYNVYMVTYYAEKPERVRDERREEHAPKAASDPEYWGSWLYTYDEANARPESYDLPHWVEKGKFLWLDASQPDLPLRSGPPEAFPYYPIEGFRRPVGIHNGRIVQSKRHA